MKKFISIIVTSILFLLGIGIGSLYFYQEKILFKSIPLSQDYQFSYKEEFEEVFLQADEHSQINALHFKTDDPKGVVLYFHGRGGNLSKGWGNSFQEFTKRGYDFFIIDYRGFGKSRGKLSEKALCRDAEMSYQYLLHFYHEKEIVVYGRSLGTGIATYVAAEHRPKMLVLEAPYFSFLDLIPQKIPSLTGFLPSLLLKYPLRTDQWIAHVDSPIHIFHGTEDELIPYDSSTRLLDLIKSKKDAILITIEKGKHNHLRQHPRYQMALDSILD